MQDVSPETSARFPGRRQLPSRSAAFVTISREKTGLTASPYFPAGTDLYFENVDLIMSHQPQAISGSSALPGTPPLRYAARWIRLQEAIDSLDEPWRRLAENAVEGNAFLSPWFLRSASRWLDAGVEIEVAVVETFRGPDRVALVAVMPLHRAAPSQSLPLPHLQAYRGVHAFTGGALVDSVDPASIIRCLLDAVRHHPSGLGALRLTNLRCDGPIAAAASPIARELGIAWFATRRASRAALRLRGTAAARMAPEPVPAGLRRARVRLESEFGTVEFRILRGAGITDGVIERHLTLEAAGWKSKLGTALLSTSQGAAFFRQVAREAADAGGAFFCELLAGNEVVASTSNFHAGTCAFAFKVGWQPRFARCSPGTLIDYELGRLAPATLPGLHWIDSCADPGSHLERIWDDRISVCDGYLAWGRAERTALRVVEMTRRARGIANRLFRGR